MTVPDQINAFRNDINHLIDRYREEFELPYAAAIGVLFGIACDLQQEAKDQEE